jgi:molybdopterin-containing oxidoreductase family membrane subunit
VPQIFWSRAMRRNILVIMIASALVNVGMWFERFVIIVTSLHRTALPSSWGMFYPTIVDILTLVGSFGLFFTLFVLFIRFVPMVAIAEVKAVAVSNAHEEPHATDSVENHAAPAAPMQFGMASAAKE